MHMTQVDLARFGPAVSERPAVWQLIGRTPLVRLRRLEPNPRVEIHAKLESRNPGGSIKDRAAAAMLSDGLRTGALQPGKTILDASSGNTGIAYAMLGAALGYPVRLCIPANVSPERRSLLDVFGASVIWTSALEGSDGAIREARRLAAEDPDRYFYPDQVQQRRQLARALRVNGARDPRSDGTPHHALRRGPRDQRNLHGNRASFARGEAGRPPDIGAARFATARA